MQGIDLKHVFTFHQTTSETVGKYERLRAEGLKLAELIDDLVPDSREKSTAVSKLRETIMWANAGIACESPAQTRGPVISVNGDGNTVAGGNLSK